MLRVTCQFTFFLIFLMSVIVDGVSVTLLAKRLKFGALSYEKLSYFKYAGTLAGLEFVWQNTQLLF